MTKNSIIFSIVMLFYGSSIPGLPAQTTLSLTDCLDQVRASTAATRQLPLVQQKATLEEKVLSRNYWPQANLGAKASWQSDVTSLPIEIPNFMVPAVPQDQYAATLEINQLIYDGGVTRAMQQLKNTETELKVNQLQSELLNTERQAIDLFFQIALQNNIIANTSFLSDQLTTSLRQAENLLQAGILDKGDVAAVRVKQLETRQKITEARYYLATAKKSLANLMHTEDTAFILVVPDIQPDMEKKSLNTRPEIEAINLKNHLLAGQSQVNDARVRPSIGSFVNAGYGRPGLNFLANSFDWYMLAGVKITVPVDHLYSRKKEMQNQMNQLEIQSSNLVKSDLLGRFERLEFQYLDEIDKLRSWIEEDRDMVELRREMKNINESKWNGGVITTVEYLNAVTELNIAQERLATHENVLAKMQALLGNLYGNN